MQGTQKHKRLKLSGPVDVWHDQSSLPVEAHMLDISYGGIGLLTKQPLKGHVEVTLYFARGFEDRIAETVQGRVVWCSPYNGSYRAGIEFETLHPKDHTLTLKVLKAFTGPPQAQST